MKCPHCKYESKYNKNGKPRKGFLDFVELRFFNGNDYLGYPTTSTGNLLACPWCRIVFYNGVIDE